MKNKKGEVGLKFFAVMAGLIVVLSAGLFAVAKYGFQPTGETFVNATTGEITKQPSEISITSKTSNSADTVSRVLSVYDTEYYKEKISINYTNGTTCLFKGGNGVGACTQYEIGTDGKYTFTENRDITFKGMAKGVNHYIADFEVSFDPAQTSNEVVVPVQPFGIPAVALRNISSGSSAVDSGNMTVTSVATGTRRTVNYTTTTYNVNGQYDGFTIRIKSSESYKPFGDEKYGNLYLGCTGLDSTYDTDVTGMTSITTADIPPLFTTADYGTVKKMWKIDTNVVRSTFKDVATLQFKRKSGSAATINCEIADATRYVKSDNRGLGDAAIGDDQLTSADVGAPNVFISIPTA